MDHKLTEDHINDGVLEIFGPEYLALDREY